jgi:hypothetical protein
LVVTVPGSLLALVLSWLSWAAAGLHSCGEASVEPGVHETLCGVLDPRGGGQVRGYPAPTAVLVVALPALLVALGAVLANARSSRRWFYGLSAIALGLIVLPSALSFGTPQ